MDNIWIKSGAVYMPEEVGFQVKELPPHVFRLDVTPTEKLYLTEVSTEFKFGHKLYNVENSFVDRVTKSFNTLGGNMGVLLNGVKGTGKTITAKLICNTVKLPVIIIPQDYPGIPKFLNNLTQEVVVFFDEYEKIYDDYQHDILTVMDGVLNTEFKKLFLLTTNESYVNTNMLQRPGRIRYFKTFGDLKSETTVEIIDDKLEKKEFREELIKFIAGLEIVTVDIVKALVDEVNIHGQGPGEFSDVFNIKAIENTFDIIELLPDGKKNILHRAATVNIPRLSKRYTGSYFTANGETIGRVKQVLNKEKFVMIKTDDDGLEEGEETSIIILEEAAGVHSSFSSYAF